jgi:MSHA biogenesis protein MshO
MRRTRPKTLTFSRGLTLIELVLAMVLVGIIVAATAYFFYPVTQSVDLAGRAALTDIADNALQRMGREVRLALPNSVRRTTSGSSSFLEFLPVRTAGRYRADGGGVSGGTDCPDTGVGVPDSDQLSFSPIVDTCFKTIGTVFDPANPVSITTNDFVVFNNYGEGFDGQNAYATSGTLNRRKISAAADETTRERIAFASTVALDRTLHDSPGKRFFVVIGNASTGLPEPVTYECNTSTPTRTLVRRSGYTMTAAQPTSFSDGTANLIAEDVSNCDFDYVANVAPQIGLLTLRLTLSRALPGGATQSVSLYHAVHVTNVP